ncbi:roadblock/LC7 domain-containing protein [Anaeromyxobacter diazotrophicus]|uniref:Roadblock/LAMTOR2 domain-containing protein n=1 Tax=Anaeromyxobacter diazotrophicus TaxID=2590199 RepID=A0A7I9VLH7_9BACT|nr:roadblock/LC7 domain-containing protein [Anaeromyxobacter diazotrophicus]GEJ57265.1 hypothetical protein AMYX_20060 [Anaeromyxobacter diazotrophicus]
MHELLAQLNAVPGVVGSLLCDGEGQLLAQAFPPAVDPAQAERAAAVLAARAPGLEAAVGKAALADFRFAGARVVVKGLEGGGQLLFLCAPSINLPFLTMSASSVVKKLERAVRERPGRPGAGALHRAVQRVDELILRSGGDRFKLRGQIALKAGFALDLVDPDSPDDPDKLKKLEAAATAVLGQPFRAGDPTP